MGRQLVRFARLLALDPRRRRRHVYREMWFARREGYAVTGRYRRAIWIVCRHRPDNPPEAIHRWSLCGSLLIQRGNLWAGSTLETLALVFFSHAQMSGHVARILRSDARMHWLNGLRDRRERFTRATSTCARYLIQVAEWAVRWGLDPQMVLSDLLEDDAYTSGWPHTLSQVQLLLEACPELAVTRFQCDSARG
jgi:hypothetical protein